MTDLSSTLEQEEARLRQAVAETLQTATARPTAANRKALRQAQKALEEFLRAKSEPEGGERVFASVLEVVQFLDAEGWKLSKSTAYDHWKKEGKLRARPDGSFALGEVLRYAADHLQRKDGSAPGANLAEEKQRAEVRRILSDAELRELKLRERLGELIPRDQVEVELAERATALKNYLDAVARSAAGRVIKIVGGDPQKSTELIAWWLGMNRKALDNYARPIAGLEDEEE